MGRKHRLDQFLSSGAAPFQIVTACRRDSDDDGTPDCSDNYPSDPARPEPGVCDCGVAYTDSDGDGTPDCSDNCPSDPARTDPGACGCGVADTDSDGDGMPDCTENTNSGGGGSGGGGCFIHSVVQHR
jgi:hypothetical protein